MFRSQQHREKAAAYGELIKHSSDQGESGELQKQRDRHSALADNEQGLADDYDSAVNAAEQDRARGLALAAEEEHVLRCLGAAFSSAAKTWMDQLEGIHHHIAGVPFCGTLRSGLEEGQRPSVERRESQPPRGLCL